MKTMNYKDIGKGRAYNADCFEVMAEMPDGCVDMVLTDVPYNEVNRKSSGLRNLDKSIADSSVFDENQFIEELSRLVNGSVYIFCGIEQISFFTKRLKDFKFSTRLGVWTKTNPSPMNGTKIWLSGLEACVFARRPNAVFNEHCKSANWIEASTRSKIHPTQKPIKLFERLIKASSNEGDLIFDPFAGSLTTGVASENLARRWVCCEMLEEYFTKGISRFI